MQAVDWAEHTELQPADIELVIFFAVVVTADIMAPPGVAYI